MTAINLIYLVLGVCGGLFVWWLCQCCAESIDSGKQWQQSVADRQAQSDVRKLLRGMNK